MICQIPAVTVYGMDATGDAFGVAPAARNPLERLVEIMNANERLMDELAASRERIVRARAYLDEAGCNVRFGQAHLDRCRDRHSGILAHLRANRIEALGILAPAPASVA